MNILTTCAILALGATKACSAFSAGGALEARAGPIGRFYFEGPFVSYDLYADFRQNVPEDGNTYPITNRTEVYSIIPEDTASNCTFVGADGTPIVITGHQEDITPQPLVNVTCVARTGPAITLTDIPNLTSFFPPETDSTTTSVSSATGSTLTNPVSNSAITTVPPYPTATESSSRVGTGTGGASASTAPSAAQPTGGNSNNTPIPFTGDAVRVVRSIGGPILVFMGLIAAL